MDSIRNNKDQEQYIVTTPQRLHYPRIVCFIKRKKHIDIICHFIRELVSNGEVHLKPYKCVHQLADIFNKPLAKDVFEFDRRNLVVVSLAEA